MKYNLNDKDFIKKIFNFLEDKYDLNSLYAKKNEGFFEEKSEKVFTGIEQDPRLFILNSLESFKYKFNDGVSMLNYSKEESEEIVRFLIEGLPKIAYSLSKSKNFGHFQPLPSSLICYESTNKNRKLITKTISSCTFESDNNKTWKNIFNEISNIVYRREIIIEKKENLKITNSSKDFNKYINEENTVFFPYLIDVVPSSSFITCKKYFVKYYIRIAKASRVMDKFTYIENQAKKY